MTKEDILIDSQRKTDPYAGFTYADPAIFKAMDEFAKQHAIAFEIWKRVQSRNGNKEIHGKTPEDLYNQFIEQQNKRQ